MLNKRCSNILQMIVNNEKPITIKEISKKVNKSPRTVRYDLDKIDDYLAEIEFPKLERKSNLGISLDLKDEEIKKLFKIIGKINNYDYVLSQKERVFYIIYELLNKSEFVTINMLSDRMMVSRSTIINDLIEVKKWLSENKITLESSKGQGIKILGRERDLRRAAVKLFFQTMDSINFFNVTTLKLFNDIDIDFIRNTIKIAEEQMETSFSDDAFNNLVIHIAIAIKRIELSKDIIMDREELKNLRKTAEYAIASGIAKMLEDRFKISIPEDEIGYITIHILGSNTSTLENVVKDDWIYLHLIVFKLIENVENITGINFSKDNKLFDSLAQHIRPAIYRLKHDIKVKNPLIEEIKEKYFYIFESIEEGVKFIEEDIGNSINQEEIGYLTLHFMASIERSKNKNHRKPNVLIVCATGIGTSKFISNKLKSIFDINIIDTISSHTMEKILKYNKNIDLIVTTIPLKVEGIKCIEVNTFLTEKNISELGLYFAKFIRDNSEECNSSCKYEERDKVQEILNIVKENCTIHDYYKLRNKLALYLNIKDPTLTEDHKPSLKELLKPDFIKLNEEAKDWEDAVRKSGEILMNNGCVKESYIDAMVNTVKNMGPYIVIAPGIAMPHAAPEDGVLKTGISMLTLKDPISFGNAEHDPVSIIISICSIDKVNHMNALKELMSIMDQEDFLSKVKSMKTPSEIDSILYS
ncbi:BglG family transcription antiterminator [Clostridium botulinum]|nr:BglG family transcription antiterminator [Clostridium botulinum]